MLRVERLSYEIKGRKLLKDVSFQVRKGEVLAILGANGAGKSTLMGLLCGEKKPTEGTIVLNGKALDQYDKKELSKSRALLSQQQQMTLAFTVSEIVTMGRYPHFKSIPSSQDRLVVEEVMALCGVESLAERAFLSLSGGEQQRVQLARVLAQIWGNTDGLLLLDEPISALDLQYQQRVLAIAKALARRGLMVVLIVHDVNFAAVYADRIIMLKNGRKFIDGTPVEVLNGKDIYTIFSVESVVELCAKTLRPHVKLEEMVLDTTAFNSLLPEESNLSKEELLKQMVERHPYLSSEELAQRLNITEFETCWLDKRNRIDGVSLDVDRLFRILVTLGKVWISSRTSAVKHKLLGSYAVNGSLDNRQMSFSDDFDLRFDMEKWCVVMLLENEMGKSLHFFSKKGEELHTTYLIDGLSNFEGYEILKKEGLSTKMDEVWKHISKNIMEYGMKPAQIMQEENVRLVRQVLALSAAARTTVTAIMVNEACEQKFIGTIHNLIDQGNRYIIKDPTFELEIIWERIGRISYRIDVVDQNMLIIEFFDKGDHLTLQLFAEYSGLGKEWKKTLVDCDNKYFI